MDEYAPNEVLLQAFVLHVGLRYGRPLPLQALHDLPVQVAHVDQLHDDAERLRLLVNECLLVADDVVVVYGCQNAHLIDRVFLLFVGEVLESDHLQGVQLAVGDSFHLEDLAVGAVAKIRNQLELVQIAHFSETAVVFAGVGLAAAADPRAIVVVGMLGLLGFGRLLAALSLHLFEW